MPIDESSTRWDLLKTGARARVPEELEHLAEECKIPVKPFEVGRYDTAVSGGATAGLVAALGRAIEPDRAMGYEADASGTSYLMEPWTYDS